MKIVVGYRGSNVGKDLLELAAKHAKAFSAEVLLVRGKTAGEDIVAFASDKGCDEILIGVKSRSKVGKILFGSTAQFVILKAQCPVVSIK